VKIIFGRTPDGLSRQHPAAIVSTWWWSGLLPWAPGTWGSLFTLPFAWIIANQWGNSYLLVAAFITLITGLWASKIFLDKTDVKDPSVIVIDETAGQFLTLAFLPVEIWWYIAGFILFRITDITKPWPASWVDKNFNGPVGIMLDDIIAAIYAVIILHIGITIVK